eukprot:3170453-Rhodomonas_salina.1
MLRLADAVWRGVWAGPASAGARSLGRHAHGAHRLLRQQAPQGLRPPFSSPSTLRSSFLLPLSRCVRMPMLMSVRSCDRCRARAA